MIDHRLPPSYSDDSLPTNYSNDSLPPRYSTIIQNSDIENIAVTLTEEPQVSQQDILSVGNTTSVDAIALEERPEVVSSSASTEPPAIPASSFSQEASPASGNINPAVTSSSPVSASDAGGTEKDIDGEGHVLYA